MAIITSGALSRLLKPGVNAIFGLAYNQYPEQYSQIFDKYMSDEDFVEDVNVNGFGLATVKPQGMSASYQDMAQAWIQRYVHVVYALGYIVTREHIEDNKYMPLIQKRTTALATSMRQTKENVAANILNRAFNSTYTYADGIELCNTGNLLSKGGTFSNKIATAADISEIALEQAIIDIKNFVDDAGLRMSLTPQKLIVPVQLEFEVRRILGSDLQNDTANNALNAMKNMGMFPGGVVVNNYLSDTDAWFIKTDCQDGLKMFQRRELQVDNDTDFDTENMKYKATERYSFGATDKRGVYGSPGA